MSGIEEFILLEGDCKLCLHEQKEVDGDVYKSSEVIEMITYARYTVRPKQQHTLFSKKGAKILVLSSKIFNPEDPDTFFYA